MGSPFDVFPALRRFLCSYPVFFMWSVIFLWKMVSFLSSSDMCCFTLSPGWSYTIMQTSLRMLWMSVWGAVNSLRLFFVGYIFMLWRGTLDDCRKSRRQHVFSSAVTFRFLIVFWRFSTTTAGPDIGLSRNELSICTITSIMFFLICPWSCSKRHQTGLHEIVWNHWCGKLFYILLYIVFVIVFLFYGAFPLSELGSHIHSKQNMI